ncbi:MAG: hypothetical protein J3Q66DRAFT_149217 [Benniella sp.]|nr:MAG: hypothetical protein J3Q66DRAFT_149217 [Benniella sp.]
MSDLADPPSSPNEHVAHQTAGLIRLLEAINYPHEISPQDVHTAITKHYLHQQHGAVSLEDLQASPTSKFLDWLIDNVSAESNWPGYTPPQEAQLPNNLLDVEQDDMRVLNQEYNHLQGTLSSLEKELADLQALETHITDASKLLDVDIHNTSVQFDATASRLAETARTTLSEYIAPEHHRSQGLESMDVDRDRNHSWPLSKRFLYQCQKELLEIQTLDMKYLHTTDQLLQKIQSPTGQTSMDFSTGPPFSQLDQLLKRDPEQDQELVRLCSTYRATKMSHIRAMARLKCLEEELQYMKDLDNSHRELEERSDMAEATAQDVTANDDVMYESFSSRSQQIQQTRQQEIELISVQRETARLAEEMEQLLSDPLSSIEQSMGRTSGRSRHGGLNTSRGSAVSLTGEGSISNEHMTEPGTNDGVLVDICERIARNDIELRFLSAAHRDSIREKEQAVKDLDAIVNQILEYYSLGITVEQTLALEKGTVQLQKGLLEAAIQECREIKGQSRRLHQLGESVEPMTRIPGNLEGMLSMPGNSEMIEQLKKQDTLSAQLHQEGEQMQENIQQLAIAKDQLRYELLHRYSNTEKIHFTPKVVHELKGDLVNRAQCLQQNYADLSDQAKEIIQMKRSFD